MAEIYKHRPDSLIANSHISDNDLKKCGASERVELGGDVGTEVVGSGWLGGGDSDRVGGLRRGGTHSQDTCGREIAIRA